MREYLKKIKSDNGLTLREMAEKIGVSYSYLSQIFYGKKDVGKNFIKKAKMAFPEIDANIFFNE